MIEIFKPLIWDANAQGSAPPPGGAALLMEDSGYILLEDGSHILLE